MKTVKIGVVGCGDVSAVYFKNLCTRFRNVEITACAALHMD